MTHAPSQITNEEASRLMLLALGSPEHRDSRELVRARAIHTQEMLGRWRLDTPEGPLHQVALIEILTGEPRGFEACYRDEDDAIDVWQHLSDTYDEAVSAASGSAAQEEDRP